MKKATFTLKEVWRYSSFVLLMLTIPIFGYAQTFTAGDTPQFLGSTDGVDTPSAITTTSVANVSITDDVIGTDIEISDVTVTFEHSWISDLEFVIVSPNGTRLALSTDNGGNDFDGPHTISYTDRKSVV